MAVNYCGISFITSAPGAASGIWRGEGGGGGGDWKRDKYIFLRISQNWSKPVKNWSKSVKIGQNQSKIFKISQN
jgi:hypothetical protein